MLQKPQDQVINFQQRDRPYQKHEPFQTSKLQRKHMPLEKHKALEQPYVFWKHVSGVTMPNCNGS